MVNMRTEILFATDNVDGAREKILGRIQTERNFINKNNTSIYFTGWNGFGATAVLTSIAQVLRSRKALHPFFGTTIYIDCTRWESNRAMQRKIAEELKLDRWTMAMFDEQEEEDDFNGVDPSSRDVIPNVAAATFQTLARSRFTMVFLNGSGDEIFLSRFGISEYQDCIIIWTFSTRLVTVGDSNYRPRDKLRYTDIFLQSNVNVIPTSLPSSQLIALFCEEAAAIVTRNPCMRDGIDLAVVTDCCLYGLLLMYHTCYRGLVWPAHAPSYWICDGIIQGDRAWETSNALHPEITFQCDQKDYWFATMLVNLNEDPKIPFLVVTDDKDDGVYEKKQPYCRWISVTLKNKKVHKGMQTIFARASSIFLAFETNDHPCGLPSGIFKHCNSLRVLVLSWCAFSFMSPPFLHCHTLRFLGLDHCKNNTNAVELQEGGCATSWENFLKSMWVINLYYTDWVEILSKEMVQHMANLMGLNTEGVRWPRWASGDELQKRLPYLRQLRIIKPIYDEVEEITSSSSDISESSFLMENTSLEILDLSGCEGLEDVVLSNNSLLRSFSLVIQVPSTVSHPKHRRWPIIADKKGGPKTSIISLYGCRRLDNLFLRGLPNLVELDLSGCAIRVLDFEAMVVDVPGLKRLFLIGCEHLRAIKWGSHVMLSKLQLELICVDTRPAGSNRLLGRAQRPTAGSSGLQVYGTIEDARLARSLWAPINYTWARGRNFNISITSSSACSEVAQPEATTTKETIIGSSDQRHHATIGTATCLYADDVFTKIDDGLAAPMQAFPPAPMGQKDCHIEIGDGSRNVQTEVANPGGSNLAYLMHQYTQSLHVHDVHTYSNTMPAARWDSLRWCHIERCPNLQAVFPPGSEDRLGMLENIWASDLLMARCVWSKGDISNSSDRFKNLRHLHLRRCLSLQFALAMGFWPSLPSLETLHIIHCSDLRHIFVPGDDDQYTSVKFPKLKTIHLYDLPSLQQICEANRMLAPTLETIRIRGCWNLRRLPALKDREPGMRRPTVEYMEKDVWDALEWDGLDAGHHPSLYEAPVHSRYYESHGQEHRPQVNHASCVHLLLVENTMLLVDHDLPASHWIPGRLAQLLLLPRFGLADHDDLRASHWIPDRLAQLLLLPRVGLHWLINLCVVCASNQAGFACMLKLPPLVCCLFGFEIRISAALFLHACVLLGQRQAFR